MQINNNASEENQATLIVAPNYTQIPNVIFDYWQSRLSPSEFSVLLFICRHTFGWHKPEDSLSSRQIQEATGISKNTVTLAIEKLILFDLIERKRLSSPVYGDISNVFKIKVKDIPKTDVQNLGGAGSKIDQGGGGQNLTTGGQKLTTQKKANNSYVDKSISSNTHTTPLSGGGGCVGSSSSSSNEKATPPESALKPVTVGKETPPKPKDSLGEHGNCHLTAEEQQKLKAKFGQAGFDSWVETIDLEAEKQGVPQFNRKYKSHYATILSWDRMRKERAGPESNLAHHRKNSKLAFETKKDDWTPPPTQADPLSPQERAARRQKYGLDS